MLSQRQEDVVFLAAGWHGRERMLSQRQEDVVFTAAGWHGREDPTLLTLFPSFPQILPPLGFGFLPES